MKGKLLKLVILGLVVPVTGMTVFLFLQIYQSSKSLSELGTGHSSAAHAGGHAEGKPAEGHGGGHAEAKPAEGHGGGHGEAKPAEGHGGGHGEAAAPGAARDTASIGLISIDEVFVNVGSGVNVKSLGLKLEIEMFEEGSRPLFEQRQAGVKHSIIEVSREQDVDRLTTIAGKLYFKERIVSRLNQFFQKPIVRDIHFSAFYLQ